MRIYVGERVNQKAFCNCNITYIMHCYANFELISGAALIEYAESERVQSNWSSTEHVIQELGC